MQHSPNAGLRPAFTNERRDPKHKRPPAPEAFVFSISSFVLTARSAVGESAQSKDSHLLAFFCSPFLLFGLDTEGSVTVNAV